jgi:hypothetical protein
MERSGKSSQITFANGTKWAAFLWRGANGAVARRNWTQAHNFRALIARLARRMYSLKTKAAPPTPKVGAPLEHWRKGRPAGAA